MPYHLTQDPSETGSETPLEVKQQVFSLISRIVGKLDYLEQEGCPALASILKAYMLQITPYEKADPEAAIKVHKEKNLPRPDAPAVNVLQSYYDQLIYALYELERLSDNKTTGTLIQ